MHLCVTRDVCTHLYSLGKFLKFKLLKREFIEENKDKLGEYLDQAKKLVAGNEMASGAIDKIKGLF